MNRVCTLFLVAVLGASPAQALGKRPPALLAGLPTAKVLVVTASGRHRFRVWIADNDQTRAQGLMYINKLDANRGMLFLFEQPMFASFWMKDTYLSLDLIFISEDGVVVKIAHKATPLSLELIESVAPVKAVLELTTGTAERIGLATGDRVQLPASTGS